MYLGANRLPLLTRPTSFARSMIFRWPFSLEESGIARVHPAVRGLGLRCRLRVLVILLKDPGAAEDDLAVLGDLDLDLGCRAAHRIGQDLAVRLHGDADAGLGAAVELLQVDPDRAVEPENLRADRLAGGVGHADAAEPERVAERAQR